MEGEYASYWVNFRHGVDSWPSSATAGWCHSSPPPGNRTQYAQALECEGGQGHQEEACPFTAVCWDRKKCHYSGIWEAVLILPGCHTMVPEGRLSLGKQVVKTSWEDSGWHKAKTLPPTRPPPRRAVNISLATALSGFSPRCTNRTWYPSSPRQSPKSLIAHFLAEEEMGEGFALGTSFSFVFST